MARRSLRFHDVYLDALLGPTVGRLQEKHAGHTSSGAGRNHQMLVTCMSNRHATDVLDFMERRYGWLAMTRIGQAAGVGVGARGRDRMGIMSPLPPSVSDELRKRRSGMDLWKNGRVNGILSTASSTTMIEKDIQGESIPALGLGTWQLTGRQCRKGVAHALELGYRHVDTAQIYDNEEEVGQGLRDSGVDRDAVFLTTKIWRSNVAPADMRRSTKESLRKLGVDRVDLLLIHWPVERVPLEKQLDTLVELQAKGKTRHVGVSNFLPAHIDRIVEYLPADVPLFAHQAEYHPFLDQSPLLARAREHDHLFTAYSPLARGRVIGHETLEDIGARHGKSAAQVTLRWLLQQEKVSAIPKAASAEHRAANAEIVDFELSADEMDAISSLRGNQRILNPGFAPDWTY